jgi:hypothetical protein
VSPPSETSALLCGITSCTRGGYRGRTGGRASSASEGPPLPTGLMRNAVTEIKGILTEAGVGDEPVGLDIVEPPFLFAMQPRTHRRRRPAAPNFEADMVADRLELQPSFNTQAHHGGGVIQFGVG